MVPDKFASRVAGFTAKWNRIAAEASVGADAKRRGLGAVRRKLTGLLDAIAEGLRASGMQRTLDESEASKAALENDVIAMLRATGTTRAQIANGPSAEPDGLEMFLSSGQLDPRGRKHLD